MEFRRIPKRKRWFLYAMTVLMLFFLPLLVKADVPSAEEIMQQVPEYAGVSFCDINGDIPYFTDEEMTAVPFETYGDLDYLGRCTTAFACVGPETMPTEGRGDISEVKPTGWINRRYAGIDKDWLYNRCHLIGFQLTGENANEKNLITGTRYLNVEGMLEYENSVAEYIRTTGYHVLYRVTPVFLGENLLCSGVLMEAKSIEDEAVQYCVFCYNVQPGITIDYASGDSSGPAYFEEETNAYGQESSSANGEYVINKNTKKYHRPECPSVEDISDWNRDTFSGTADELKNKGYAPCKRCNPG